MSLVDAVAAEIREEIGSLKLLPGARLRSVRELSRHRQISQSTAADVYNALVASGSVEARKGTGYFVAREGPLHARADVADCTSDSLWEERDQVANREIEIDAGGGWLPTGWQSCDSVRAAMRRVARLPSLGPDGYGNPYGLKPLRSQLVLELKNRNIAAREDQLVLTQGASQALDLLVRTLLKPGDLAVVEEPGYPPLFELLRAAAVRMLPIPRTDVGPDVDALALHLKRKRQPTALFTNTTLQNPTGTSTTAAVAHRLLELAERYDFRIIEDDIFCELSSRPPCSLASLDQLRRVAYVTSFSKSIDPALRVGYLACDSATAKSVVRTKVSTCLASSEIAERIVLSILTNGPRRRQLENLRSRLEHAQQVVASQLEACGVKLAYRPCGGMFLWGKIPSAEPANKIWSRALNAKLLLAPGERFLAQPRAIDFWRFNVAHSSGARLMDFLARVCDRPRGPVREL